MTTHRNSTMQEARPSYRVGRMGIQQTVKCPGDVVMTSRGFERVGASERIAQALRTRFAALENER